MNIKTFCDVQGIVNHDAWTLQKMYGNQGDKTYEKWYELISPDFQLHPQKPELFSNYNPPVPEKKEEPGEKEGK